jgi:hypothetical protein
LLGFDYLLLFLRGRGNGVERLKILCTEVRKELARQKVSISFPYPASRQASVFPRM